MENRFMIRKAIGMALVSSLSLGLTACKVPLISDDEEELATAGSIAEAIPEASPPVEPSAEPSAVADEATPVEHAIRVALPHGYTVAELNAGLAAEAGDVTGKLPHGTDLRIVATHPCKEDVVITHHMEGDLEPTVEAGQPKTFTVTFASNRSNVTFSLPNPTLTGCGAFTVDAADANGSTTSKSVLIDGTAGLAVTSQVDFFETGFAVATPTLRTTLHGSHDITKRTLALSHQADSIECSYDGGASFRACDAGNTRVFTLDEYASGSTLKFRLRKTGMSDVIESFDLGDSLPGLTFARCTVNITQSESLSIFEAQVESLVASDTICLDPGVAIAGTPNDSIDINASNVTIIGTEDSHSSITTDAALFVVASGAANIRFAHLNLVVADSWWGNPAILFNGGTVGSTELIQDVNIQGDSYGIYVFDEHNLTIEDSRISDRAGFMYSGVESVSYSNAPIRVNLARSVIDLAEGIPVGHYAGELTIEDSELIAQSPAYQAVYAYAAIPSPLTLTINDTLVRSGYAPIGINSFYTEDLITLNLNGNRFQSTATAWLDIPVMILDSNDDVNGNIIVNSTRNDNTMCRAAGAEFGLFSMIAWSDPLKAGSTLNTSVAPQRDQDVTTCR